jgi:hypothetical protein
VGKSIHQLGARVQLINAVESGQRRGNELVLKVEGDTSGGRCCRLGIDRQQRPDFG